MKSKFLFLLALCINYFTLSARAQEWIEVGTGANALKANFLIWTTCFDTAGNLYAAGSFTNGAGEYYVAKWDGSTWNEVRSANSALHANSYIYSLVADKKGNLYAGGIFTDSLGHMEVAKWDGNNWTELGTGIPTLTSSQIQTMCLDSKGNLYAGGYIYNHVSNCYDIAKWNGTAWSYLKTFSLVTCGTTRSLITDDSDYIYAGGSFEDSGHYSYVAKYVDTAWIEVGRGAKALNANSIIETLCTSGGIIYAAGDFDDSLGHYNVFQWDGNNWSKVGTGANALNVNGGIRSICTDANKNIYASGIFSDSSRFSKGEQYVAKWNGATWGKLGAGANSLFNDEPINLIVDKYNNVYAAGAFTDSSGYRYVAEYTVGNTLGIDGVNNPSLQIFPNPATDNFTIILPSQIKDAHVEVYNSVGEKMQNINSFSNRELYISTSNFSIGMYYVRVISRSNSITAKIVIE